MRGNPVKRVKPVDQNGSIPARAGEPVLFVRVVEIGRVYPRACGGTYNDQFHGFTASGLSPRVRGNRSHEVCRQGDAGSIPARAGEPTPIARAARISTVYPRACGGTRITSALRVSGVGLSPRVRGNLPLWQEKIRPWGSIPARAGEPSDFSITENVIGVYPRACGGTSSGSCIFRIVTGLSPRVRGNPHHDCLPVFEPGSIPARAGEPLTRISFRVMQGVYPRACGGTSGDLEFEGLYRGLSPRVRGNRNRGHEFPGGIGSIPARAGEPSYVGIEGQEGRVYPRACGGTVTRVPVKRKCTGLSPRVRGNPSCR